MEKRVALEAEPLEAVFHAGRADLLDDKPHRARLGALRRMAQVPRSEKDLPSVDRNIDNLTALLGAHRDVTPQLVEEFLVRIVVVVRAPVRPADDHHDQVVGLLPHLLVAYRWAQQMA